MQAPSSETPDTQQTPQPNELLPLIDQFALDQWSQDLEPVDVQDVLDRIPNETHQSMGLLLRAIESHDLAMARRAAHRLKGMAANLGAARLANDAKFLELSCANIDEISARLSTLKQTLNDTLAAISDLDPAT